MNVFILPLVNWSNGIVMISVFAGVCVALVGIVLMLMSGDKKKEG